ncbi:MAG: flagellar motor switch phosphatase FliY [Butyrivibrio sp.]|uniref:Flagellar motor switch protein FliN/FliY n=1 Tax=Butyrivibrio hungatei TaxID=185008 RepID=A0A1G5DKU3_9FIRM|nr:flagellar motor switch phosphatase FliY [Butyrivibrio hungatei]MBQ4221002.1 flagellar motor switch phosphatase FliY [Butyrivibrio sp.]MBR4357064.1 flagellar motor switch phosphatase FliY [Butyrivibrio sp.]MEE3471417.1 flagellar motor switch phosphatase FliY [Butyrivibrio hungatei]SCY15254.1 flagellar motor switch protein FliN/FliY [Butyrivibrio hungatei]
MEDNVLTGEQMDTIGEIANISMGNSATTLSLMVNRKVEITTPNVKLIKRSEALDDYEKTCIFVQIHYVKGLEGNNVLILKEHDVKVMTDLMMGGDGTNTEGEISDLHLSAASEAMNQMMGTSATSLSSMLGVPTDISTPVVNRIDVESIKVFEKMFDTTYDKFVKIAFRMTISDLIDSVMVQLYPIRFAKDMCNKFYTKENAENNE